MFRGEASVRDIALVSCGAIGEDGCVCGQTQLDAALGGALLSLVHVLTPGSGRVLQKVGNARL